MILKCHIFLFVFLCKYHLPTYLPIFIRLDFILKMDERRYMKDHYLLAVKNTLRWKIQIGLF